MESTLRWLDLLEWDRLSRHLLVCLSEELGDLVHDTESSYSFRWPHTLSSIFRSVVSHLEIVVYLMSRHTHARVYSDIHPDSPRI